MLVDCARSILGIAVLAAGLLFAACASASDGDRPVSSEGDGWAPARGAFAGIRGIVSDSEGLPLAEAGVAVTAGTAPVPEMLMLTAEDGSYSWPLPAGTFSLTVTLDGYRTQTLEATVPEEETVELDFQLEREP
ncbi:MAG TPA: carboxypeptidase regulatory-like domain-containing protein [Candidatus Methanoperedens sp.]|nr:carboxypeptidase regulatory-like domain-containing protein [Candidatus Methanoperedens sp.]